MPIISPEFQWLGWVFSGIGALMLVVSMLVGTRARVALSMGMMSGFYCLGYTFLGFPGNAAITAVHAVRGFTMSALRAKWKMRVGAVIFATSSVTGYLVLGGIPTTVVEWLPVFATVFSSTALTISRIRLLKSFSLVTSLTWITFFVANGLWTWLVAELIAVGALIFWWYRDISRARRSAEIAAQL